ncbi:RidA family protein [Mesorhizobium mediterraneum]|uniref:RidA family protein n=1 Tax=Mesorhizobium mediterraneum TaxID=43617 RepID=UPI00177CE377|nr:RidA family protein [Mesorhizobium mediterraneum]
MDETIGNEALHPLKSRPRGATQHVTAGPYSPVLQVDARHLVVISGQVAVDMDGNVVGDTIEEQAAATLQNCERQLATADCGLRDVFKVNVYLADLRHWARFQPRLREGDGRAAARAHCRAVRSSPRLPFGDRNVGRRCEGVVTWRPSN